MTTMENNNEEIFGEGLEESIFSPSEYAATGTRSLERIEKQVTMAIGTGIKQIDSYFAPMLPGQVCAVIAQTGQYKSGFLHFIEHHMAQELQKKNAEEGKTRVLVHISVEETIEEQAFLDISRHSLESSGKLAVGKILDWDKIKKATYNISQTPIFHIGDSLENTGVEAQLYLTNMLRAVEMMADQYNVQVAGLFFDYLQAFPIDVEHKSASIRDQRRLQVRSDMYRIKRAAAHFRCPAFVAVQAKQHLSGEFGELKLPGIYDGEESSAIAQRADRILTLWLPKQTNAIGSHIEHNGLTIRIDEDLLVIRVAKQRGGLPSGRIWLCKIDYRRNDIKIDDRLLAQASEEDSF